MSSGLGKIFNWAGMGLAGLVLLGLAFGAPPYAAATLAVGLVVWAAACGGLRTGLAAGFYGVAVLLAAYLRHALPAPWYYLDAALLVTTGGVVGRLTHAPGLRALEEDRVRSEREKQAYDTILDHLPDVTFAVDVHHRVIMWNKAAEKLSGVKKEDMLGRGGYEHAVPFYGCRRPLLVDMILGDRPDPADYEKTQWVGDRLVAEGFAPIAGRGMNFWSVAAPLYGPDGGITGAVQSVRDIGERKKTERELLHLGTHDHLTGLCNRAYFQQKMQEVSSRPVSVIVCDVDCLKMVNDTFGHLKGDELLRRTAAIIAGELRSSDCVARVGGDEFAVLLPDTDKKTAQAICGRLGERVKEENLARPDLPLGISAGSATTNRPGEPMEEVFKRADEAMYRDKALRSAKQGRPAPGQKPEGGCRFQRAPGDVQAQSDQAGATYAS